ncbi:MAG: M48 family metalloprotease [Desulfosarcina sp.]|nr:M48 family metalloprotease [Desulfobacterales bacterium]
MPLKSILKLFTIYLLSIILSGILLPAQALSITAGEEEDMGLNFMKMARRHFEFIEDPVIIKYINKIGDRVIATLPPQPFKYHFYMIHEDVYNAFAVPGGHVFINSGLFGAMEGEDELAGILAHEISHVLCRHISQRIARSSKIGMATFAGMIAGILLGINGSGAAASAMTISSAAAGQSIMLAFSRENEMQADQIGLKLLSEAGYSGKGLLEMLKKIRDKTWFSSKEVPSYLMTHPAVEDRIAYIDVWIEAHENSAIPVRKINPFYFERAHTRLEVVYGDENNVKKKFETELAEDPSNSMANYRLGIILARMGNRDEAILYLKKALGKNVFEPNVLKDLGRIYFLNGDYREALNTLKGALSIAPDDSETLFLLSRTNMGLGNYKGAAAIFKKLIEDKTESRSRVLYFLGKTCGKQNKLGDAHYYLGLYYKEKRDRKNAFFHLQKSLEYTKDKEKKKKIRVMLGKIRGKKNKDKSASDKNLFRMNQKY